MTVGDETETVRAVPLANQLQEGAFSYAPHTHTYFGHHPELEYPEMDIAYTYDFICAYNGPVHLVMEPESIAGTWILTVNGKGDITEKDFTQTGAHVRGSRAADITGLLEQGENRIELKLKAYRHDHGLRNPLYLAGNFGVELSGPPLIVPQKTEGIFEAYRENLLPYFAGEIEYTVETDLDTPEGEVLARFDTGGDFHEACEVSLNGGPFRPLLWEPRVLHCTPGILKKGRNKIVIRVATTLIRSFEGQYFDYKEHCYRDVSEESRG
jgi:hypothetical protein